MLLAIRREDADADEPTLGCGAGLGGNALHNEVALLAADVSVSAGLAYYHMVNIEFYQVDRCLAYRHALSLHLYH